MNQQFILGIICGSALTYGSLLFLARRPKVRDWAKSFWQRLTKNFGEQPEEWVDTHASHAMLKKPTQPGGQDFGTPLPY